MDKKLKIAFVHISQGVVNRGSETFITELSERLKSFEVLVLSNGKKLPSRWPLLWRFFLDPSGLSVLFFTLRIIPILLKEKPDLVIPVDGGWQAILVRFVTLLYGGKVLITGHSGKGWDDRVNLWCFPDAFVGLSSQIVKWAKLVNPFVKCVYIPNGIDMEKFSPKGAKLNLPAKSPVILCVGALTKEKRIDLAIKAVSKLDGAFLMIVGDGPLKEELEYLGKRLLGDRFIITKLDYSQMPKVYRAADAFTLPSREYMSFEIVVLEALASNLPVVVNDDPIRREIVGSAGILINPENLEEYVRGLKNALGLKVASKFRKRAEDFSWDIISTKYTGLILEVVNEN